MNAQGPVIVPLGLQTNWHAAKEIASRVKCRLPSVFSLYSRRQEIDVCWLETAVVFDPRCIPSAKERFYIDEQALEMKHEPAAEHNYIDKKTMLAISQHEFELDYMAAALTNKITHMFPFALLLDTKWERNPESGKYHCATLPRVQSRMGDVVEGSLGEPKLIKFAPTEIAGQETFLLVVGDFIISPLVYGGKSVEDKIVVLSLAPNQPASVALEFDSVEQAKGLLSDAMRKLGKLVDAFGRGIENCESGNV